MDSQAIIGFAAMSFALIVIPGPSVLFVIGRSLSLGRRGGLLSVLGNELGGLPLVVLVAAGVGNLVAYSAPAFLAIKLLGALYLIYLGVQAIVHRRAGAGLAGSAVGGDLPGWRTVLQGALVGVTNPKTVVFFVAVLPQFVNRDGGDVPLQMITLGLIFTAIAFCCDAVWALIASSARHWFATSPRRLSAVRSAGGGMLIGMGAAAALMPTKG